MKRRTVIGGLIAAPALLVSMPTQASSGAVATGAVVETLILVLAKDSLRHGGRLSLALTKKNEPNISRVLYNKLREDFPDVREYSGNH